MKFAFAWRWIAESIITALCGVAALAYPVIAGDAIRGHSAAFMPVMADIVEGISVFSLCLLFCVGVSAGILGRAPVILLGVCSAVMLPLWSAVDFNLGGPGHNLLPIEWIIYGFTIIIGTAGVALGRTAVRLLRSRVTRGDE